MNKTIEQLIQYFEPRSRNRKQIFNGRTGEILRNLPQQLGNNGGAPNVGDFDADGFPTK